MQPYSREAVPDRRQPHVRWSAIFAGAAMAAGLWLLLQLLFTGGALTAIDPDEIDNLRAFGIGATISSVLAPLLAMFFGGLVAGRLASHYDRRVAGMHGALVWAITSIFGLVLLGSAVSSIAADRSTVTTHGALAAPAPGTQDFVEDSLDNVNARLKQTGAPTITLEQLIDASRNAGGRSAINRDAFVARLDNQTNLSRPEAEAALGHLGDRAPDVIAAATELGTHRAHALEAAETAGKGLLAAGVALFLCLALAVAGAIFGARRPGRDSDRGARGYDRPTTIPGPAAGGSHTTAPYPTTGAGVVTTDPTIRRDPLE